jgi:outer membrane receptor protein involved in Fe transport
MGRNKWVVFRIVSFTFACIFALLSITPADRVFGQGIITGSLSGTVLDQTEAVIPNAAITAVNDSTKTTLQVKTNAEGTFLISNVPIGTYTISIEMSGFGTATIKSVDVVTGNTTSIGKRMLTPGSTAQTVQVEAGAAELLNTDSAQGESVFDSKQLATFPVNGAFDDAALLVPGVVATHMDNFSNTNGAGFSANGQRGRSNNFEIDGQSNNDNSVTGPQVFFSNQDAIQEIQVISNNFSAQYGRNMGAVINYVTKSGTNQLHGSAFEFYTGSWLSSLTQGQKDPQFGFCPSGVSPSTGCSAPVVPRFVQNNFGGTIGGPILKDKLFFFGSTYWGRSYQGGLRFTTGGNVFPDPTGLKQLQAAFPNNPGVAALVLNGPYAYPTGNPTPFGATSLLPVTDGNTTANIEVSQYQRSLPNFTLDQEHLGRVDYQLGTRDRFYVRYFYQDNPTEPGAGNFTSGGFVNVVGTTHSIGGDWTHTFAPNLVNQLRYSFQQAKLHFDGGGVPSCTITSFASCPSQVTLGAGLASSSTSTVSFGYASNFPQGRTVKVTQIQDNASWTRGRHSILFGGEFDYQNSPNVYLPNAIGSFDFAPGAAGIPFRNIPGTTSPLNNGLTGLLEGISQTDLTAGNITNHFTEPDYALYFQDDWKVLPNFTLNLGLRYEFFSQSINLLHDESVAQQTGPNPFWNTSLPLSATTFPKINSFYKNIEPRIGFAWNPDFAKQMVVHGGFAINVDPAFDNIFINIASGTPVTNAGSFVCDGVSVQCVPGGGLTYATVQAGDSHLIPTGSDPRQNPYQTVPTNFRNPMAESYTFGVQYQLAKAGVVEVRYVGNHTFHQFQSLNTNPDIADVQAYFPNYGAGLPVCTNPAAFGYKRINCNYSLVQTTANTAFSIYNGLQTSFTARSFHNWTGTVSYTYSRAIDNVSEIFSTGGGGTTSAYAQNPLDPNVAERGVSGNSYPSVVGLQMNYSEPWFREQKGMLGRLLGGYSFNAFYSFNNGQPFNPFQATTAQSPFVNQSDPQAATGFCDFGFSQVFGSPCRPILSNSHAPLGSVGINTGPGGYINYATGQSISPSDVHWLWNNQYEAIARGNPFPGSSRNILRGDSFNDVDVTVSKQVRLTERVNMQLQMSAFNALNRGYYGTPDANIEDSLYPAFYGIPSSFLNNYYASGGGATYAAGGAYSQGPGNRSIQLGGKLIF